MFARKRGEFAASVDFGDGFVCQIVDDRGVVAVCQSGVAAFEDARETVDAVRAALVAFGFAHGVGDSGGVGGVVAARLQDTREQGMQFVVGEVGVGHGGFSGCQTI